ncbi:MAG: aconitase X catalytic domain-containing protein [Peptococcaceae bacterium]|nr:aconitase X catalytic domain-containing protein [Peptococcaceae bacterium]
MKLTKEQQALWDGAKGDCMAKIVKTLVLYGDCFGADEMVPVTGTQGHLVTSFGISTMKPVYDLITDLLNAGVLSSQPFSVDPRPLDPHVPAGFLQSIFFRIMYSKQAQYEAHLNKLGLINTDAFTCACYLDEVGNKPEKGDILSWAESSAVVYANSVLGARCNRNSAIIELFGSIAGFVPSFGLLTDEGRKATWIIDVATAEKPEAQILGSAIGLKVVEGIPYIKNLDKWLDRELTNTTLNYLKDMGAATAADGAVGLYHVENLTPEAKSEGERLIAGNAQEYRIDDAELSRVRENYPVIWKNPDAKPKLCFVGCPHLSYTQLIEWTDKLSESLTRHNRRTLNVPTVFTTAPPVLEKFRTTPAYRYLTTVGVVVSGICPLMYMNNPLCGKQPIMTNSNKLRTYSSARYYTDDEILALISKNKVPSSKDGGET